MRVWSKSIVCVLAPAVITGLAACSTHPLPDDLSRETSTSIIHNIRCEAKGEVRRQVESLLVQSRSAAVRALAPEKVIEKLATIRAQDPALADTIERYSATAIAYGFEFHITENNNNSASALFSIPFVAAKAPTDRGSFSLGLSGGANLTREAERSIKMVENFKELAALDCSQAVQQRANLLYPITGSIGMAEVIKTFLKLGESGVGGPTPTTGADATFSDHVTFTTKLQGKVTPTIALAPLHDSFRLVNATASIGAERTDVHDMLVTLVFPKTGAPPGRASLGVRSRAGFEPGIFEDTKRRAAEELCIQSALAREDDEGIVRLSAPERYCIDDFSRFTR
jgi:hypothetical protein